MDIEVVVPVGLAFQEYQDFNPVDLISTGALHLFHPFCMGGEVKMRIGSDRTRERDVESERLSIGAADKNPGINFACQVCGHRTMGWFQDVMPALRRLLVLGEQEEIQAAPYAVAKSTITFSLKRR